MKYSAFLHKMIRGIDISKKYAILFKKVYLQFLGSSLHL